MSKIPALTAIRIIPRDSAYLDRRIGSRGEIFFDQNTNSLRIFNGQNTGGFSLAKSDLSNVSNQSFLSKAQAAGVGGGSGGTFDLSVAADDSTAITIPSGNIIQFTGGDGISTSSTADGEITITNTGNSFSVFTVTGQNNVEAQTLGDSISLAAGSNITITTDSNTNTITFNATASASSNVFSTIAVTTQPSIVADSVNDTLTLTAGSGISITTDASTDTITIANTITSISFDQLIDASAASLDIDQIYLPAITRMNVTNSGASAYLFDQYVGNNPTIFAIGGTTIAFKLLASGHPFLIQDSSGNNFNTGLVHVTNSGVITTGASAQGKDSGTLYWKIPGSISGNYRYQCSAHEAMVGAITVKNIVTL